MEMLRPLEPLLTQIKVLIQDSEKEPTLLDLPLELNSLLKTTLTKLRPIQPNGLTRVVDQSIHQPQVTQLVH